MPFGRLGLLPALLLVGFVAACGGDASVMDARPEAEVEAALKYGDATDVTWSDAMPMRATGRLSWQGRGSCTASAIARNVVLFAAHCLCPAFAAAGSPRGGINLPATDWTFYLPYRNAAGATVEPGPNPGQVYAPGAGGIRGVGGVDYYMHPTKCDADRPPEANRADLAVIVLSRPLTEAELPEPLPIYTSGDLVDRIFNLYDGAAFFGRPFEMVGWGGSATVKKAGSARPGQELIFSRGFIWLTHDNTSHTKIEHGDSGGPLTFRKDGGAPVQFGVSASMFTYSGIESWFEDDADIWSPTYNAVYANGDFVAKYLVDGDGDEVVDSADNCAPARCPWDAGRCNNVDQADADMDGVGDACDVCAPARCTSLGLPISACADASQADQDRDGVGDVCDLCPEASGSTMVGDDDGDGLPSYCDNCSSAHNPLRACRSSGDCATTDLNGSSVRALCVGLADGNLAYGACGNGSACLEDADCPSGPCGSRGQWGRCSRQLDDADNDGVGLACDSCPAMANRDVQVDNNVLQQSRVGAEARGDVCDPVPVLDVRQQVALPTSSGDTSWRQTTWLWTHAALGRRSAAAAPATFTADVELRYCSCIDATGAILDEARCLRDLCNAAHPDAWMALSVTRADGTTASTLTTTFSSEVSCDSSRVLAEAGLDTSGSSECSVGPAETLRWNYGADVERGIVRSAGRRDGAPVTAGIVWSQAVVADVGDLALYASVRDANAGGALREHFAYVTTPLISRVLMEANELLVPIDEFKLRFGASLVRTDLFGGRPPIDDPWGPVSGPAWLLEDGGRAFAVASFTRDVTATTSDAVRMALSSKGVRMVSPSQPTATLRSSSAPMAGASFAIVPSEWRQAYGGPLEVRFDGAGFDVTDQDSVQLVQWNDGVLEEPVLFDGGGHGRPPAGAAPDLRPTLLWQKPVTSAQIPGDRDGAFALLAPRRGALLLVGGVRGDAMALQADAASAPSGPAAQPRSEGSPTDEIWSYSFATDAWQRLFTAPLRDPAAPFAGIGRVEAAAFDEEEELLMVLDTAQRQMPNGRAQGRARLVVWDLKTQTHQLVLDVPRLGLVRDVQLVPRGAGRFALVARHANGASYTVHNLRVSGAELIRDGSTVGTGVVLPGAHEGASGVVVPVLGVDGQVRFDLASSFGPAVPLGL